MGQKHESRKIICEREGMGVATDRVLMVIFCVWSLTLGGRYIGFPFIIVYAFMYTRNIS